MQTFLTTRVALWHRSFDGEAARHQLVSNQLSCRIVLGKFSFLANHCLVRVGHLMLIH